MDYYRILDFEREPFSNSPDPGLFFESKQHVEALQKLEISIRLKRGLNVITGDVGTGKTTLSRQLIQKMSHDPSIRSFLILDPGFPSTSDFLTCILNHLTGRALGSKPGNTDDNDIKEQIKKHLFSMGVDNNKTTVLMIDEGQKLPIFCLEILRELLNYETNDHKLLQIIIFAQKEFNEITSKLNNFNDRINLRYTLSPFGYSETKELIKFRIKNSCSPGLSTDSSIPDFSFFSYIAIYRATKGYPRKIINLCHHIILGLIIKDSTKVGYFFVTSCARAVFPSGSHPRLSLAFILLAVLVLIGSAYVFNFSKMADVIFPPQKEPSAAVTTEVTSAAGDVAVVESEPPSMVVEPVPPSMGVEQTPQKAELISERPKLYGRLRVPKDENLSNIIRVVYGSYLNMYLHEILNHNPNIKNADHISADTLINFPIISQADNEWEDEHICLVFAKETDLETAVLSARKYQKMDIDVRIIAVWDSSNTFLFSIVLDKPFPNRDQAIEYKKKLAGVNHVICETVSALNDDRKIL